MDPIKQNSAFLAMDMQVQIFRMLPDPSELTGQVAKSITIPRTTNKRWWDYRKDWK